MKMNPRPVLSGDLEVIPLADLFQLLGGGNCTGVLVITGEFSPYRGEIHFASGEPVDAAWGTHQGIQAVYALFGWSQARFEFRQQDYSGTRRIRKSRMEIILDAMRMLDDGLIRKVGARHSNRQPGELPTITGPMIDYDYILSEEKFLAGKRIVSEGSYGNWIWVILEGTALISRGTPGIDTSLCYLGEGAFIGSLETLLFGDHVRTATVTATRDVHSALLDTHRLSSELMGVSTEFRNYLLRLSARVKEATDDLISLVGERRSKGRGWAPTPASNRATAGSENIELEKFQDQYALLSRTFKGFIQCTANTLSVVAKKTSDIRSRTLYGQGDEAGRRHP